MSANVETMFSVRETPWHKQGIIVSEAPTSKEAIELAGLDWTVNPMPIYDQNFKKIDGFVANTRSSDNSVLGIVSDRYRVVQNSDAFAFTDSLIGEGLTYETAGSLKQGRTVWLLGKLPEQYILGDKFEPYICFANTHDGSGAVKVCCTTTRVVCNNTLNIALSSARRMWSTKHMGNIQEKLEEAKHTLKLANEYNAKLGEEADRLSSIKVSDSELEEIFDLMFPIDHNKDSERKINNIKTMKDEIYVCYMMPDISQFKGTAWGVMNAVSDYVCHSEPARKTETYRENNWGKIMCGHPLMDSFYNALCKKSA